MTLPVRALTTAVALTGLLTVGGCGGDTTPAPLPPTRASAPTVAATPLPPTKPSPGPRPTLTQLAEAVRASTNAVSGQKYTAKQARCISEALLASDLSNGSLNAIAANVGDYVPPKSETKTFQALLPKIVACSR